MRESDAGALSHGDADQAIALVARFAGCFHDRCRQDLIEHAVASLMRQPVFAPRLATKTSTTTTIWAALAGQAVAISCLRSVAAARRTQPSRIALRRP
jgi:hypothetical protein